MKVKTEDLIGPALDWAVAQCLGVTLVAVKKNHSEGWLLYSHQKATIPLEYSSKWAQGGPIMEREGISPRRLTDGTWRADFSQAVLKADGKAYAYLQHAGPTSLVAAMRCFIASRFGDEVDIPEELLT